MFGEFCMFFCTSVFSFLVTGSCTWTKSLRAGFCLSFYWKSSHQIQSAPLSTSTSTKSTPNSLLFSTGKGAFLASRHLKAIQVKHSIQFPMSLPCKRNRADRNQCLRIRWEVILGERNCVECVWRLVTCAFASVPCEVSSRIPRHQQIHSYTLLVSLNWKCSSLAVL